MHLPHLLPSDRSPIVFLTTCTHRRLEILARPDVHLILQNLWSALEETANWYVGRYLLMPDHIHLFAQPGIEATALAEWMKLWKGASARAINCSTQRLGTLWQAEYFDRFIRSRRDYEQKWEYVRANPVRSGLVRTPEEWPYQGIIRDLRRSKERD